MFSFTANDVGPLFTLGGSSLFKWAAYPAAPAETPAGGCSPRLYYTQMSFYGESRFALLMSCCPPAVVLKFTMTLVGEQC